MLTGFFKLVILNYVVVNAFTLVTRITAQLILLYYLPIPTSKH